MQLCAITGRDNRLLPAAGDATLAQRLRESAAGWVRGGVHFIQLREKDLDPRSLASLAREIVRGVEWGGSKLLLNIPAADFASEAAAAGADGVHLAGRPKAGAAGRVRRAFRSSGREAIVSMACHTLDEVRLARREKADFALFAPVFEKRLDGAQFAPGRGLEELSRACEAAGEMPVLALGGVTAANAAQCIAAGAAGIAGIRLFETDGWRRLSGLSGAIESAVPRAR